MTSETPTVSTLRSAAARAVAEDGLRSVSDGIGISFRGLKGFLDGSTPRRGTILKLITWHQRQGTGSRADLREARRTGSALIVQYVGSAKSPEGRVDRLREVLTDVVQELGPRGQALLREAADRALR